MASKVKVGVAAAVLFGIAIVLWQVVPVLIGDDPVDVEHVGTGESVAGTGESVASTADKAGGQNATDRDADQEEVGTIPVAIEGVPLGGTVVDRITGEPVKAFGIEVYRKNKRGESKKLFYREIRDDEGEFQIRVVEEGHLYVCVYSSCHRPEYGVEVEVGGKDGGCENRIELEPAAQISGRVVDDETGEPVAGAIVFAWGETWTYYIVTGQSSRALHSLTDEQGRFTLGGLENELHPVVALHPGYASAFRPAVAGSDDAVVRLGRGHRIFGTVRADDGRPCSGIVIETTDIVGSDEEGYGLRRCVLTDDDGRYRTAPLHPGSIEMTASHPREREVAKRRFTAEKRKVEIVDQDVEVSFGPSPSYVCWRGTVVDRLGLPLDTVCLSCRTVEITGDKPPGWASATGGRFDMVDEEGRFVRNKLLPGRYRIMCRFGYASRAVDCGELVLESPGVVERNVEIPGGAIRGTVIDGETGLPPAVRAFRLQLDSGGDGQNSHSMRPDEKGLFLFRGLPPGIYTLKANLYRENRNVTIPRLTVTDGELLDGIALLIPARSEGSGKVNVLFHGLGASQELFALLRFSDGNHPNTMVTGIGIDSGPGRSSWTDDHRFKAGAWTLQVEIDGLGRAKKGFHIFPGKTTDVEFFGSDFTDLPVPVALTGFVRWSDGEPVEGARVLFESDGILGPEQDLLLDATTDDEGAFRRKGLLPGKWKVQVVLADGGRRSYPVLEISRGGDEPAPYDLVLQRGAVTGTLVDEPTGQPFEGSGTRWRALLRGADKKYSDALWRTSLTGRESWLARVDGVNSGSLLAIAGLHPGSCVLHVQAEDFFDFVSGTITIAADQKLDLGRIPLKPGGVLIHDTRDGAGNRIEHSIAEFPDLHHFPGGRTLPDGREKRWRIPFGTHRVFIKANGYKGQLMSVTFVPGVVEEIPVVLEKLPE
jgi:hypothetical protein